MDESVYYNPYNTAVYAILFGLLAIYVLFPAVKRLDVDIDRDFFLAMTPWMVLGGAARALKDIGAVDTILLETPLIYFELILLGLAVLFLSRKIEEKYDIEYFKTMASVGTVLLGIALIFYTMTRPTALVMFGMITVFWVLSGFVILKLLKPELVTFNFMTPVAAHYLDATSTFVALNFNAEEKHVLGRIFIDIFGPSGMFLMKTLVIVPVVYYINEELEGEEKMFYLFIITMLGVGIATRNLLQTVSVS